MLDLARPPESSWVTTLASSLHSKTREGRLTARFLLHELPLAVDDTQGEQGQQHGGQSTADDGSQGRVPRAGGRG